MVTTPRDDLRPSVTEPVVLMISRRQVEACDIASVTLTLAREFNGRNVKACSWNQAPPPLTLAGGVGMSCRARADCAFPHSPVREDWVASTLPAVLGRGLSMRAVAYSALLGFPLRPTRQNLCGYRYRFRAMASVLALRLAARPSSTILAGAVRRRPPSAQVLWWQVRPVE